MVDQSKITYASSVETTAREREVQLLINVIEPDPEYQSIFVSDESTFLDISALDTTQILSRLEFYFGSESPVSLDTPIWKAIDILKQHYQGWPDEYEKPNH